METTGWIDISVTIHDGMVVWPGDPSVRIERSKLPEEGMELSTLALGAHAGTHVDAPLHYLPGRESIDQMPFEAMIGPARVIEILDPAQITAEELTEHDIGAGERVLFKTRNSRIGTKDHFVEDFVHLSTLAAEFLANRKILTVGIDYLSVGGYRRNEELVHRILLEAGIWIVENLHLSQVGPGDYEFFCLPLKILDAEGAPARAILRPLQPA